MEDGVVFRHSDNELPADRGAARTSAGLQDLGGRLRVEIEDVTDDYGMLAVQGPRSRDVLAPLAPEVEALPFFGLDRGQARLDTGDRCRRTGYTGDLGFELTVPADDAVDVLDAVLEAGPRHGIRPFGEEALMMLRIEAGLPLDRRRVAQQPARLHRPRPGDAQGARHGLDAAAASATATARFVGSEAIRRELADEHLALGDASASSSTGPTGTGSTATPACSHPRTSNRSLRVDAVRRRGRRPQVGYVTSFMYSPVLQRHIGLARVRPTWPRRGTGARRARDQPPQHHGAARTARLPLFNPARKTAMTP